MVDMASVVAPPASDFSTARVGPRPVRGLGEKGPRMNLPFPMSLGSTKEALSAKEGRPGEERGMPCDGSRLRLVVTPLICAFIFCSFFLFWVMRFNRESGETLMTCNIGLLHSGIA